MTLRSGVILALAEPAAPAIAELDGWLRTVAAEATGDAEGDGFLVVTPLGMARRTWLEARLAAMGIVPRARVPIARWSRVATAIRVTGPAPEGERLRTAALFEAAWRTLFPQDRAEAWGIVGEREHGALARAKRQLRSPMPTLEVDFGVAGEARRLLTPLHLADPGARLGEARRLLAAVRLLSAEGATRAA